MDTGNPVSDPYHRAHIRHRHSAAEMLDLILNNRNNIPLLSCHRNPLFPSKQNFEMTNFKIPACASFGRQTNIKGMSKFKVRKPLAFQPWI
jgi:hypothetical protein